VTDFIVSIANIFIDDIVTWREEIHLSVTGGAGLHALSGCRVWNEQLGIVASVGKDVRPLLPELRKMGIDTQGLVFDQEKTNRAWQIFQPGDLRVEVMHDPSIPLRQAIPDFKKLPEQYLKAAGYHILWNGEDRQLFHLLEKIRWENPTSVIVLEPSPNDAGKPLDYFKSIFPLIDGFSPSLSEAQSILKINLPEEIIRSFLRLGCRAVALRLGSRGSLAGDLTGKTYRIPPADANVVDVTGASNAYAGGWLCSLIQHKPMPESLGMAAVSASFEIEQYGLGHYTDEKKPIRDARLTKVMEEIKEL